MVSPVDAASALADLTEISTHVEAAAILDESGKVVAATPRGERLAEPGQELLRTAAERLGRSDRAPMRIEAALRDGSVAVVAEGGRTIVARTAPRPPSALLFHDLAACLRSVDASKKRPRRRKDPARA
jgi:hypothetical protein